MRAINQMLAVTWLNLRNLPQRVGSSFVAVIGVAAVVLVFAAVLSMAQGFERTMITAGADDTAIILRDGATSELTSGMSNEQVLIIADAPGVLKDGDQSVLSAELYVIVDVKKISSNTDANVPFRGVQSGAFDVRKNVKLADGRMFEEGKNEIIVGRAAQQEFVGLETGTTIRFGQSEWQIVGSFEAGGSVSESELWTDVRVLQSAYRRGNSFQSVRVKLQGDSSLEELKAALDADPRINPDVFTEKEYYSGQAEGLTQFIKLIGYPLTILMSIGAIFGALNSMYSSVSVRGKEIATLRALGFGTILYPVFDDRRVGPACACRRHHRRRRGIRRLQRLPGIDAKWPEFQPGRVRLCRNARPARGWTQSGACHRRCRRPVPGHPRREIACRAGSARALIKRDSN